MRHAPNFHALQPIVNTGSGEIIYHEMLIRFGDQRHVQRAIEEAEASRTVHEIDLWILDRALAMLGDDVHARIAVNLSPVTVEQQLDTIIDMVRGAGAHASRLVIELTETAPIFDSAKMFAFARAMGTLGIRLAIDDFGSGYCDAGRVALLGSAFIKVPKAGRNGWATMLPGEMAALHRLARNSAGTLIAEGIETLQDLRQVTALGFVGAQGFLFFAMAPAMAVASVGAFVHPHRIAGSASAPR